MTAPAITGWVGQTQMRKNTANTDYVTVYTDIKNATPQKLEYGSGVTDDEGNAVPIPPPTTAGNLLVLSDDKLSYTGTTGTDDDDTVKGTINGISGTFTCTTGTCSVTFAADAPGRADNTVATIGGEWMFKSEENYEPSADQDSDYLYFGYWLEKPNSGNDYEFNTFFGGSAAFTMPSDLATNSDATWTNTTSKATYTGKAGGMYVKKALSIVDGALKPTSITHGSFTADAELTAYFGLSSGVSENEQNSISGTISNFMDGNTDLGFRVKLDRATFATRDTGANQTNTFSANSVNAIHGTTQNSSGSWNGMFFGPAAASGAEATTKPTGVAGEFDAHFSDGRVSGGFGATR